MNSAILNPISAEAVALFTVSREIRTASCSEQGTSTRAKGTVSKLSCASYPTVRALQNNFLIFGAPVVLGQKCLFPKVLGGRGYLQFTVNVSSLGLRMLWAGEVKLLRHPQLVQRAPGRCKNNCQSSQLCHSHLPPSLCLFLLL